MKLNVCWSEQFNVYKLDCYGELGRKCFLFCAFPIKKGKKFFSFSTWKR